MRQVRLERTRGAGKPKASRVVLLHGKQTKICSFLASHDKARSLLHQKVHKQTPVLGVKIMLPYVANTSCFWDPFLTVTKFPKIAHRFWYMKPALLYVHKNQSKSTHQQTTNKQTQVSWKCWVWTIKRLRRKNLRGCLRG